MRVAYNFQKILSLPRGYETHELSNNMDIPRENLLARETQLPKPPSTYLSRVLDSKPQCWSAIFRWYIWVSRTSLLRSKTSPAYPPLQYSHKDWCFYPRMLCINNTRNFSEISQKETSGWSLKKPCVMVPRVREETGG